MKIPILGKTIIIGETDKRGKNVKIGLIDSETGKGKGIYIEPEPVFER